MNDAIEMNPRNREYDVGFEIGFLFLWGGNQLSRKDPRTADEIASVGYNTGPGNIVVFVGPWAEAEARFRQEIEEIKARLQEGV